MSKPFLTALVAIFAAFAGYEWWLASHLAALNDDVMERCVKPSEVMRWREEFYFAAGTPISRSVMVR